MAANWIKIRINLSTDPRVVFVAASLGKHACQVVGALVWLWALADEHTTDGRIVGYTKEAIDRAVGMRGFCEALVNIKDLPGSRGPWLELGEGFVQIPDFEVHNGESAKERAKEQAKKARQRRDGCPPNGPEVVPPKPGQVSPKTRDQIREDKRREEQQQQQHSGGLNGQSPGPAAGAAVGLSAAQEAKAKWFQRKPEWLPQGKPWISKSEARRLALLPLGQEQVDEAYRAAKDARLTLDNPAGLAIRELRAAGGGA